MSSIRDKLRQLWWQIRTPGRYQRAHVWFNDEAVIHRWKVLVAVVAALFTMVSFNHALSAQAVTARHQLECDRAERQVKLVAVLDRIVDLSDLFAGSDDAERYTSSRVAIITALLPPIDVPNCP